MFAICNSHTLPLNTWTWQKAAVLGIVLSAIALVATYFAGGHAAGDLCAAGLTPFAVVMMIHMVRKSNEIPPYKIEDHAATIKEAIVQGKEITWDGKPENRDDLIWILPNFCIGNFTPQTEALEIMCVATSGRGTIHTARSSVMTKGQFQFTLDGFADSMHLDQNEAENAHKSINSALQNGTTVVVKGHQGDSFPKSNMPSFVTNATAKEVNAGLFVIQYLSWITGLEQDTVLEYATRVWKWSYAEKLSTNALEFAKPTPYQFFSAYRGGAAIPSNIAS